MFPFINISSSVVRSLPVFAAYGISRCIASAHESGTGRASRVRSRGRKGFGFRLLPAAVLASLSGTAATNDSLVLGGAFLDDPGYAFELSTNSQRFATETFNGALARFTRIQPNGHDSMQVRLRLVKGFIGSYRYDRRPPPMSANIEYCLLNGAQFARKLRDGGIEARNRNNGPALYRDGRSVEVLRYGDFEFLNADRDGDNIDLRIVGGGGEGHSCVTVRMEINSTNHLFHFTQHTIEPGDGIVFNVPALKKAHTLGDPDRPIDVRVRMRRVIDDERGRSGEGMSFAERYQFHGDDPVTDTIERYENGVKFRNTWFTPLGAIRGGRRHIAHSAPALLLELVGTGSHTIHHADFRRFADGDPDTNHARLATLTLQTRRGTQYTSNGTRDFTLQDPHSNRHRLRVTVSGPFTPGDRVFLDNVRRNLLLDEGEEFEFNDDRTVATGTFDVAEAFGNRPVYFVASPDHNINPGDYTVQATYDFDYRSYRDLVSDRVVARINGNPSNLEFRQTASAAVYATEVFGEGSEETVLEAGGMSTTLTALGAIPGSKHRMGFELEAPAVFGEDIQASHLKAPGISTRVVPGTGTAGSRSVEFIVDNDLEFVPIDTAFTFDIPSVRNAGALAEAGGTIGVSAFAAHYDDDLSDDMIFMDSTTVARSAPGFVFGLFTGDAAVINPDHPAKVPGDPNVDTDSDGVNDTRALMLGTLVLDRRVGEQHDHDGGDIPIRDVDEVILMMPDLSVNEGDRIFIDLDSDRHIGLGESFAFVDEDHEDFPAAFLTLSGPDATTGLGGAHVYYVPAGTEDLPAATYTLTADYEFGRADGEAENYRDLVVGTKSTVMHPASATRDDLADVDLDSLVEDGLVDAVPGSGEGNDIVIRIVNTQSSPVTVYVQGLTGEGTGIGRSVAMVEIVGDGMISLTPERTDALFCGEMDDACWYGDASFRFFRSPGDDIDVLTYRIGMRDDADDGNNRTDFADVL